MEVDAIGHVPGPMHGDMEPRGMARDGQQIQIIMHHLEPDVVRRSWPSTATRLVFSKINLQPNRGITHLLKEQFGSIRNRQRRHFFRTLAV